VGYSGRSSFEQSRTPTAARGTSAVGYSGQSSFEASRTPTAAGGTSAVGYSGQSSFQASAQGAPAGVVREPEPGLLSRLFGGGRNGVPSETTHGSVRADEAQRTPEFIGPQEQAVLASGGQPVQFPNSNGQTEALQFSRGADGWSVSDAHNNSILVRGQEGVTEEQLAQATAEIADYWTQQPTHLRGSVSTFELARGHQGADFTNVEGGLITMGHRALDEKSFDHEFGHAIGHAQRPLTQVGQTDFGRPPGWDAAMQADGSAPSRYANDTEREDFAESWLAYTEAREAGPERLAALKQAYPNRMALIEQLFNGTTPPPQEP